MTVKSTLVSMGRSLALMKGTPGRLSSGPLTYCSAALFQAKRNGEVLANLMTHRGIETAEDFRKNLLDEIKSKKLDGKDIEWDLVAFQTANSTETPGTGEDLVGGRMGQHECTAEALISDSQEVLGVHPSNIRPKQARAPKGDDGFNALQATIESTGKAEVPQRTGGCVIM